MLNDRRRILELALESLEMKKKLIEEDIAEIRQELHQKSAVKKPVSKLKKKKPSVNAASKSAPKKPKFTEEEKHRRSQRMKAYWENQRKKQKAEKK